MNQQKTLDANWNKARRTPLAASMILALCTLGVGALPAEGRRTFREITKRVIVEQGTGLRRAAGRALGRVDAADVFRDGRRLRGFYGW